MIRTWLFIISFPVILISKECTAKRLENVPISKGSEGNVTSGCLHRLETKLGQNPPIQSTSLRSALQRYETLHKEATKSGLVDDLHRYVKRNEEIRHRYIIYSDPTSHCGLGNRLLMTVSTFLLSLLTDRVFLVQFGDYRISEVFCQPFGESSWEFPEDAKWTKIQSAAPRVIRAEEWGDGNVPAQKLMEMAVTHISESEVFKALTDGDVGKRWRNVQIVRIAGTQYFLPVLFANPYFKKKLLEWFPDLNVATVLFRYLLHPSNDIWKDILDTYKKTGGASGKRTGLQIRSLGGQFDLPMVQKAVQCLDANGPRQQIFLASLHPEAKQYVYEHRLWEVEQKYASGRQEPGKEQAAQAIHDIWVLSMCDHLYLTKRSTLGYIAASIKGTRPSFLARGFGSEQCAMAASHEPCLHRVIELGTTLGPNMTFSSDTYMICDDDPGIKLKVRYP